MGPYIEPHGNRVVYGHKTDSFDAFVIFEAIPEPYLVLSTGLTVVAANNAYLNMTSISRYQIIGRGIFDVLPDNSNNPNATDVKNLKASLERVIKTKQPDRTELQEYYVSNSGSLNNEFEKRYWSSLNSPVLDNNGKLLYIIHHIEDVTEMVKARKQTAELEESEAKFRTITNALPQIVWSTLPDGSHDHFNDRFYEYTGLPYGSSYGEKWIGLVHPEDQERLWKTWRKSLSNGECYEIEYRIRSKTGEYRWILARALPIRNKDGNIIRWFGTSTDIHEQKQTQAALNEAIRDREMFFSIASHELKSPLTTLGLQTQLQLRKLKTGGLKSLSEEGLQKTMETINQQTMRLVRLVDEMLDVSRITSGKFMLEIKSCDLCELLREAIDRITPQFQKSGVSVPNLEKCEWARGQWDPLRIEQVITNLLTNALRYGNGKPIIVRLENFESTVQFSVQDKGIGISEKGKKTIFNRFERATSTSKKQGLGLGLYITKEIVAAHGGKIWVESELGQGSTFHVELPRGPV